MECINFAMTTLLVIGWSLFKKKKVSNFLLFSMLFWQLATGHKITFGGRIVKNNFWKIYFSKIHFQIFRLRCLLIKCLNMMTSISLSWCFIRGKVGSWVGLLVCKYFGVAKLLMTIDFNIQTQIPLKQYHPAGWYCFTGIWPGGV